jgi:hypothetical protein
MNIEQHLGVVLNGIKYAEFYQRFYEELEVRAEVGGGLCQ